MLRDEIWYRARLSNGIWTDWLGFGKLAGTRGKGEDLTGFAVRLGDKCQEEFDVKAIGAFRGEADNVVVGGGEDCVPKSGHGPLYGMQIIVRARADSDHITLRA